LVRGSSTARSATHLRATPTSASVLVMVAVALPWPAA
jgi:hypothetical protein